MESAAAQVAPRVADGAVCLLPNLAACAELRESVAALRSGKLPPALTFRQLAAAVRVLPEAGPEKILRAAQLGNPDPADDSETLEIFSLLRENSSHPSHPSHPSRPPAADLRLASLWSGFFREMDEHNLRLPATRDETLARVAAADNAAARAALSEMVGQLFDIWKTVHAGENSAAARHRRALAKLADDWKRPLFVVGPETEREPAEADFCNRIQQRGGECVFVNPPDSVAAEFARQALNGEGSGPGLQPFGPEPFGPEPQAVEILREHFCEYRQGGAASLTAAAELALSAVAEFARGGAEKIGVVVFDRVLARRVNALARNAGKVIADRDGWRAETLAFGAALRMLAEAGADSFSPDSLSEILQAPPLFAGQNFQRERAESEWRTVLQNDLRLPGHYGEFSRQPESLRAAAEFLSRLAQKFSGRKSAGEWLNLVRREAEDESGILKRWRGDDSVSDRVLELLRREMQNGAEIQLDPREFRVWFSRILESPVRVAEESGGGVFFISPVGAVMRKFDALILLGGGADFLPSAPAASLLTEREKQALGLPGRVEFLRRQRLRFCRWVGGCKKIALVWRGAGGREEVRPSPYWELLADALRQGGILPDGFAELKRFAPPAPAENIRPPRPARARLARLPPTLYATCGDRLMRCPYVFFARDILKLKSDDADAEPSPALLGVAAHRAMREFAAAETDETDPEKILRRLDSILAGLAEKGNRPGFHLALRRWRARAGVFAEWESRRRKDGWRTVGTESDLHLRLDLGAESEVILRGRADRTDRNGDGLAIVDYKTGMVPTRRDLDDGEVPQLPLYAAMTAATGGGGGDGATPEWLLCRPFPGRDERAEVRPKTGGGYADERSHFASLALGRLRDVLSALLSGAALPASGAPATCARCAIRGLCRRDHWAGK